jgi:hypothetical protein
MLIPIIQKEKHQLLNLSATFREVFSPGVSFFLQSSSPIAPTALLITKWNTKKISAMLASKVKKLLNRFSNSSLH